MKIKEFLEKLDESKSKNLVVEVKNEIIKKITIEKMNYEIKNDELYLINSINLDFIVINLNAIRNISIKNGVILIFLDDKSETKIKIVT